MDVVTLVTRVDMGSPWHHWTCVHRQEWQRALVHRHTLLGADRGPHPLSPRHTPVSRRQCTHKHSAPASHGGGASTCPRDKLHSFSRDQLVLSLLPSTIHTAPLTPCALTLTPRSNISPSHSSLTPCHPHPHTSLPHYPTHSPQ